MSITTLYDNLTELGLTWKIMRRAALERDNTLRAAWLDDTLLRYTADEIVFLDESSKDGHTVFRKYGRDDVVCEREGPRCSWVLAHTYWPCVSFLDEASVDWLSQRRHGLKSHSFSGLL
jgi:hypothetical protein